MPESPAQRKWRLLHPELVKASKRAYYLKHREAIIARVTANKKRRQLEPRKMEMR